MFVPMSFSSSLPPRGGRNMTPVSERGGPRQPPNEGDSGRVQPVGRPLARPVWVKVHPPRDGGWARRSPRQLGKRPPARTALKSAAKSADRLELRTAPPRAQPRARVATAPDKPSDRSISMTLHSPATSSAVRRLAISQGLSYAGRGAALTA